MLLGGVGIGSNDNCCLPFLRTKRLCRGRKRMPSATPGQGKMICDGKMFPNSAKTRCSSRFCTL